MKLQNKKKKEVMKTDKKDKKKLKEKVYQKKNTNKSMKMIIKDYLKRLSIKIKQKKIKNDIYFFH